MQWRRAFYDVGYWEGEGVRAFTVKVSKCGECLYANHNDWIDFCKKVDEKINKPWPIRNIVYAENKDGITPSCPMYESSVEVAE